MPIIELTVHQGVRLSGTGEPIVVFSGVVLYDTDRGLRDGLTVPNDGESAMICHGAGNMHTVTKDGTKFCSQGIPTPFHGYLEVLRCCQVGEKLTKERIVELYAKYLNDQATLANKKSNPLWTSA